MIRPYDLLVALWADTMVRPYDLPGALWADTMVRPYDLPVILWADTMIHPYDLPVILWADTMVRPYDLPGALWADTTVRPYDLPVALWADTTVRPYDLLVALWADTMVRPYDLLVALWADTMIRPYDLLVALWADTMVRPYGEMGKIVMTETPLAVDMQEITIRFPGVLANDRVNFTLRQGEIHALLGENGAGKSTLMSVLSGLYKPTSGVIKVNGRPVSFGSPRDAIAQGIGMVHQHFMLAPTLTVTENILLGLDTPRFFMNLAKYDQEILALQEQFGLRVDPRTKIWQLSVGEQQRVEILKTLYRGANVLIFDEPTAVLAPQEIAELIKTMRSLTDQGKSIIFISHKLNEVEEVADRITVLRKGKGTAEGLPIAGLTRRELAQLMVGRDVVFAVAKETGQPGGDVLVVTDLQAMNNKGAPALRGLSLTVRQGEILGVAGVAGNGQSELAECITGLRPCLAGSIQVNGQELANQPPIRAIESGVAHIPEDRNHVGSAPNLTITDNVIMKQYRQEPIGNGLTIHRERAGEYAQDLKERYEILAPSVRTQARKLSGGNLQKVILSREITLDPRVIVAVQPTRGLDVGAVEAVQRHLLAQRQSGAAILLISEELEELFTLSDRIAVLFDGRVMGVVDPAQVTLNEIGLMMTGTPWAEIVAEMSPDSVPLQGSPKV